MDTGYILIMATAMLAGGFLYRQRKPDPPVMTKRERVIVALGGTIGGTICAKIPAAAIHPDTLLDGSLWWSDGRTITFGLVGGYLGVEVAKWALGVKAKTGDAFAIPLAVSVAIGRLGCWWSGCCFGAPTEVPWAMDLLGDGVLRHPNPLYEFLFHMSAALVLWRLEKTNAIPRQRVKAYYLAYFTFRLFTEELRPEPEMALGLTLYQWACIGFIPLFLLLWRLDAHPPES